MEMPPHPVPEDPEPAPSPRIDFQSQKRRIIMLFFANSALMGAVMALVGESASEACGAVLGLLQLGLGIAWVINDAKEREHPIGGLYKLLLAGFFIIGLPIYLVQSRGLGAFRALGMTLVLIAGMVLCFVVMSTLIATVAGMIAP